MTFFLIGLPVFISSLMALTALIFCIRNYDLTQSLCLKHALQAQERINKAFQDLLNLNPLADKLRHKQRHLEQLYRSARKSGALTTALVLRAKIEVVRKQRSLLDSRQKAILNGAVKYVESGFESFKGKIKPFHPGRIWKEHYNPVPLAVKAQPRGDIAPSYHPLPGFSAHQTFTLYWEMPLYRFLPKWLKRAFFKPGKSLYHCSATIKKIKGQWTTALAPLQRQRT